MIAGIVENASDVDNNIPYIPNIITNGIQLAPKPPTCVIITGGYLGPYWQTYRDWLTSHGYPTEVIHVDYIYANFQGIDNPEKIRNYIINCYVNDGIGYILLGANVSIVPGRICRPFGDNILTDLYYADLDGDWDSNHNGVWGDASDEYNIGAEVMIARVPAENGGGVINWYTKRIRYESNPGNGDLSYLSETMVSSSDQLLDYNYYGGTVYSLSKLYDVDTTTLREVPNGASQFPTQPSGINAVNALSSGIHILELMCHGNTERGIKRDKEIHSQVAKPQIELPALIWNPYHIASGDSILSSLTEADYQALQTNDIVPYFDSLNNYHLFVMGGILEHGDSIIEYPLLVPRLPGILSFLRNGGSLFWEGGFSCTLACDTSDEFCNYLNAATSGAVTNPFSYLIGKDSTYFSNIDSIGYEISMTDNMMGFWEQWQIAEPVQAPQAGARPSKGVVCVHNSSRTMTTNFSWSRLHDRFTNTRRDLIIDIMNWLSAPVDAIDDDTNTTPVRFSLSQNYPNPFNAQTTISYVLPQLGFVRLSIYNLLGQKVTTLFDGVQVAGEHSLIWYAECQPSGVYFARLEADGKTSSALMTLLK
jgi:hypothetical protein